MSPKVSDKPVVRRNNIMPNEMPFNRLITIKSKQTSLYANWPKKKIKEANRMLCPGLPLHS
jgi:hypothetical protein